MRRIGIMLFVLLVVGCAPPSKDTYTYRVGDVIEFKLNGIKGVVVGREDDHSGEIFWVLGHPYKIRYYTNEGYETGYFKEIEIKGKVQGQGE